MRPIRLMSGFVTVGAWTLLSRVLGFIREAMLIALIGPGPVMDAFVAAFRLPNMFRRFFAEGAFNAAFVPMFAKKLEDKENAREFAQDAFAGLSFVVLLLVALAMIFMPALVWLTAEGFTGDARFDLTIAYGRIVFPYILCMSLAALFSGILNATGRFAVAAAAPVLLNIFTILAMAAGAFMGDAVITWLIWAIPLAGVAQLSLTWRAARQAGFSLRPKLPRWTPDMRAMIVIALPAAFASGVMQINLVVGQLVASHYENAVSWLFAADRLYQLPLGVVGIAVGIVLLPDLARRLQDQDELGAHQALSRAAETSLALTLPSAVALIVIPAPLVSVLFERGAADASDTQAIATAVAIYALGLPAFVLQKVLQPVYFAREDTKRPFQFALVAMVVNACAAVGLSAWIGWIAPAVATTLAGWAMLVCLAIGARRYGTAAQFDARFHQRIWRIILASALMGGTLWLGALALAPLLELAWWRVFGLIGLLTLGAISYFIIGQLIGAVRFSEFRTALRRQDR
ncbi:MAG: murein biosynthesis integral membrane protein MurJ [Pseudomonadota bacterium]